MSEIVSDLREVRESLRQSLMGFPEGLRNVPSEGWWMTSYRFLRRFERSILTYSPDVQTHFSYIIATAKKMLVDQLTSDDINPSSGSRAEVIEQTTGQEIYALSRMMSEPFCDPCPESIEHEVITMDEVVRRRPDILKMSKSLDNSKWGRTVHVKNPRTKQTYTFPLPPNERIYYKGGIARLMLNLFADSPEEMVINEIPWSDLDVVVTGNSNEARLTAKDLGVDPDGIEMLGSALDFTEYCLGRDVDHNQVLVGENELHFTQEALRAAKSGHITLTGLYMPNRALYGTDIFHHRGVMMGTPRGLMRLVKPLVEGKAMSFSIRPANRYIDMTPYFLFLARKWSSKEAFPVLLQRLMEIGKRIGQVPVEENDPVKMIENIHLQYPLFDLGAMVQSERDVAIWKAGKLIRQADREFTWRFGVPGDLSIPDEILHQPPTVITLQDFVPDPEVSELIIQQWGGLAAQCQARTEETRRDNRSGSNRYFLKNESWLRFHEGDEVD